MLSRLMGKVERLKVSGENADPDPDREIFDWCQDLRVPQWIDPKLQPNCRICDRQLGAKKNSSHHCRLCGWLVCPPCSVKRHVPSEFNQKNNDGAVRVCRDCLFVCHSLRSKYYPERSQFPSGNNIELRPGRPTLPLHRLQQQHSPAEIHGGGGIRGLTAGGRVTGRRWIKPQNHQQQQQQSKHGGASDSAGQEFDRWLRMAEIDLEMPARTALCTVVFHPPRWALQFEQPFCADCRSGFGALRTAHNCRLCGLLVCGQRCSGKLPVASGFCPKDKLGPRRVCHTCIYFTGAHGALMDPSPWNQSSTRGPRVRALGDSEDEAEEEAAAALATQQRREGSEDDTTTEDEDEDADGFWAGRRSSSNSVSQSSRLRHSPSETSAASGGTSPPGPRPEDFLFMGHHNNSLMSSERRVRSDSNGNDHVWVRERDPADNRPVWIHAATMARRYSPPPAPASGGPEPEVWVIRDDPGRGWVYRCMSRPGERPLCMVPDQLRAYVLLLNEQQRKAGGGGQAKSPLLKSASQPSGLSPQQFSRRLAISKSPSKTKDLASCSARVEEGKGSAPPPFPPPSAAEKSKTEKKDKKRKKDTKDKKRSKKDTRATADEVQPEDNKKQGRRQCRRRSSTSSSSTSSSSASSKSSSSSSSSESSDSSYSPSASDTNSSTSLDSQSCSRRPRGRSRDSWSSLKKHHNHKSSRK